MRKRDVFIVSFKDEKTKDPVYDMLCETAVPLGAAKIRDPANGVFVLLAGADKRAVEKLSDLCLEFWGFYLDVSMIYKRTFLFDYEYVLMVDQSLPVLEEYVFASDEKQMKKLKKRVEMLSQAGKSAREGS